MAIEAVAVGTPLAEVVEIPLTTLEGPLCAVTPAGLTEVCVGGAEVETTPDEVETTTLGVPLCAVPPAGLTEGCVGGAWAETVTAGTVPLGAETMITGTLTGMTTADDPAGG